MPVWIEKLKRIFKLTQLRTGLTFIRCQLISRNEGKLTTITSKQFDNKSKGETYPEDLITHDLEDMISLKLEQSEEFYRTMHIL